MPKKKSSLDIIRTAAATGNFGYLVKAVEDLRPHMEDLQSAWDTLTDALDSWQEDKAGYRDELDTALSDFEIALNDVIGSAAAPTLDLQVDAPASEFDVLVQGDPFDGLTIEGPYPAGFLGDCEINESPWWIVELRKPTIEIGE